MRFQLNCVRMWLIVYLSLHYWCCSISVTNGPNPQGILHFECMSFLSIMAQKDAGINSDYNKYNICEEMQGGCRNRRRKIKKKRVHWLHQIWRNQDHIVWIRGDNKFPRPSSFTTIIGVYMCNSNFWGYLK